MENQNIENWRTSDEDAFLISVKGYVYYYAIQADLEDKGNHWYKKNKKTGENQEVLETEIIDWIQNRSNEILKKCPCVIIENGHLKPLVERKNTN